MKIITKTSSGYIISKEYPGTFEDVKKKVRKDFEKKGWTEVAEIEKNSHSQFKIMGEK